MQMLQMIRYYCHSNIIIYAMKAPPVYRTMLYVSSYSCLIQEKTSRQSKEEKGRKFELKDERQKTILSGKAVCGGNTGECGSFDHPAIKSEVSSLEVVNWHSWAITSQRCDFAKATTWSPFSESFQELF